MAKYTSTITQVIVHPDDMNPIYCEEATAISLEDVTGGMFVRLTQDRGAGLEEVWLDFEEFDKVVEAVKMLRAQLPLASAQV